MIFSVFHLFCTIYATAGPGWEVAYVDAKLVLTTVRGALDTGVIAAAEAQRTAAQIFTIQALNPDDVLDRQVRHCGAAVNMCFTFLSVKM